MSTELLSTVFLAVVGGACSIALLYISRYVVLWALGIAAVATVARLAWKLLVFTWS